MTSDDETMPLFGWVADFFHWVPVPVSVTVGIVLFIAAVRSSRPAYRRY